MFQVLFNSAFTFHNIRCFKTALQIIMMLFVYNILISLNISLYQTGTGKLYSLQFAMIQAIEICYKIFI